METETSEETESKLHIEIFSEKMNSSDKDFKFYCQPFITTDFESYCGSAIMCDQENPCPLSQSCIRHDCKQPESSADFCPPLYSGWYFSKDCKRYFECNTGAIGTTLSCEEGLLFDRNQSKCIDGSQVNQFCNGPRLEMEEMYHTPLSSPSQAPSQQVVKIHTIPPASETNKVELGEYPTLSSEIDVNVHNDGGIVQENEDDNDASEETSSRAHGDQQYNIKSPSWVDLDTDEVASASATTSKTLLPLLSSLLQVYCSIYLIVK